MHKHRRPPHTASFPATRWTLVARLQGPPCPEAARALEDICHAYWYPLYVFARRCGLDEPDAGDAVQSLFERMIKGNGLARADAGRGRLRAFLMQAMRNEISREREKRSTAKRGGGHPPVSLDATDAEGRYLHDPAAREATPEQAFERKWAMELLGAAKAELKNIYAASGRAAVFEALASALDEGEEWKGHAGAAGRLGRTAGALKVLLHRLRRDYRSILFRHIRATVESDAEVTAEASHLLRLFSRSL